MPARDVLHRLVDAIPELELGAARRFLEYLRARSADPMVRALQDAEDDDEPTDAQEDEGSVQARQEYLRGQAISAEDAKRDLLS